MVEWRCGSKYYTVLFASPWVYSKSHRRNSREGPDSKCSSTLSLTFALDGVDDQRHAPAFQPRQRQSDRRLSGCRDKYGRVRKISPPTGIRSPARPALTESLYLLTYRSPGRPHRKKVNGMKDGTRCELYGIIFGSHLISSPYRLVYSQPVRQYCFLANLFQARL